MPVYVPSTKREIAKEEAASYVNNINLLSKPVLSTPDDVCFQYLLVKNRIRGFITDSFWSESLPLGPDYQDVIPFMNFSGGMTRVFPLEPAPIRIDVSDPADARQVGDGARTIVLTGLSETFAGGSPYLQYTIDMPTTTGPQPWFVTTPTSERMLRLLSMHVIDAGVLGTNVGTITASQVILGNLEPQLQIAPGHGRSRTSAWTTPAEFEGYIPSIYASWSGANLAQFQVIVRSNQTGVETVEIESVISDVTSGRDIISGCTGIHVPERNDIIIRARRTSGLATSTIQVSANIILDRQTKNDIPDFGIPI